KEFVQTGQMVSGKGSPSPAQPTISGKKGSAREFLSEEDGGEGFGLLWRLFRCRRVLENHKFGANQWMRRDLLERKFSSNLAKFRIKKEGSTVICNLGILGPVWRMHVANIANHGRQQ
ncbi:hypothetical protein U1Q18_038736, partial [Sarracenia purpurea var. burkii]